MEAQVENAVEVALNPEAGMSLKQQVTSLEIPFCSRFPHTDALKALEFITHIKDSRDAWRVALTILVAQPTRYVLSTSRESAFANIFSPAPVRHFALQLLDSAIKRGYGSLQMFSRRLIL